MSLKTTGLGGSAGAPRAARKTPAEIYDVGDVLLDELKAVKLRREVLKSGGAGTDHIEAPLVAAEKSAAAKEQEYIAEAAKLDLCALSISGGGIRSAAFALGVSQGLAKRGLLGTFDYLSTVSGGGYIGAFLTLWIQRAGLTEVIKDLRIEGKPLQHLRQYSSYLTPHKGLISSDTLTVVALYVRNLILNWLVLVPVLLSVILLVKLVAAVTWETPATDGLAAGLAIFTVTLVGLALLDSLRQRPGWESEQSMDFNFAIWELAPMFLGGICASGAALKITQRSISFPLDSALLRLAPIGAAVWAIAWIIAFLLAKPEDEENASTKKTIRTSGLTNAIWAFVCFALSGALTAVVLCLGFYAVDASADRLFPVSSWKLMQNVGDLKAILLLCVGPGVLISSMFAGELIYVGLTSYTPWSEGEREWLARAAGYHGRAAAGWTIASILMFGGSLALFALYTEFVNSRIWLSSTVASVGGIAGTITALLGKASTTVATLGKLNKSWQNLTATATLALTAPLFVAILVSGLSASVDLLAFKSTLVLSNLVDLREMAIRFGMITLIVAVLLFVASLAINTNRFSLHALYRNRLIRAFLGASNAQRNANKFTDFDEKDNMALADLWPNDRQDSKLPPPFLVTNCALNILATKELAWQERKAMSFSASPRAIGSGALRDGRGAYRRSQDYSRRMTVGTAITISGAAASPNMGYHSSSGLSVLLTMFNVRLGAWLGNPAEAGERTYRHEGPRFAAVPLAEEALGLTSDSKKYVYLSDGGHFEKSGPLRNGATPLPLYRPERRWL